MKYSNEILKNKEIKRQEKLKEHNARVNEELLEVEKALNTYESDLEDTKMYVTVPLIIKTQETKDALTEHGYIIDKVSNDIEVNTTRIWLDKTSYEKAIGKQKSYEELAKSCLRSANKNKDNSIKGVKGINTKELDLNELVNRLEEQLNKQQIRNKNMNVNWL